MVRMPTGDWISVTDAAGLLGLTRRRVLAIIADGRLRPSRVGNQYLLLRSEVEVFAKLPRTPGRPAANAPAAKKPAPKKQGGKK